jgi:hypothetical protein
MTLAPEPAFDGNRERAKAAREGLGLLIRRLPSLAKCNADKADNHQNGSCYHDPMRILHL